MRRDRSLPRRVATRMAGLALCLPAVALAGEADWRSPEALVEALYASISADPGEARDWARYRALFADGARLAMAGVPGADGRILAMDAEGLVAQTEAAYARSGFHEIPLVTRVERHGALASVTSSFEVRLRRDDPRPAMRGLNHFQLLHDGDRWWIVANAGTVETPDAPLDPAFLPAARQAVTP